MKLFGFNISRQSEPSTPPLQRSVSPGLQAWLRGDDADNTGSVLSNAFEQVVWVNRFIPPLHVNTSQKTVLRTDGTATLIDSPATISGGFLSPGNVITIEAFGTFIDPGGSAPHAIFTLKLGSTTIVTTGIDVPACGWHLRASITVRSSGTTGTVVGSIAVLLENPASGSFPITCPTATVNTTTSLTVDLLASIANTTGTEAVTCEQLMIHLE